MMADLTSVRAKIKAALDEADAALAAPPPTPTPTPSPAVPLTSGFPKSNDGGLALAYGGGTCLPNGDFLVFGSGQGLTAIPDVWRYQSGASSFVSDYPVPTRAQMYQAYLNASEGAWHIPGFIDPMATARAAYAGGWIYSHATGKVACLQQGSSATNTGFPEAGTGDLLRTQARACAYDPVAKTWTIAADTSGYKPPANAYACEDPTTGYVLVLCGNAALFVVYDVAKMDWVYHDTKANTWSTAAGTKGLNYGESFAYFPPTDKFYVFLVGNYTSGGNDVQVVEMTVDRSTWARTFRLMPYVGPDLSRSRMHWIYDPSCGMIVGGILNGKAHGFHPDTGWYEQDLGNTAGALFHHHIARDAANNRNLFISYPSTSLFSFVANAMVAMAQPVPEIPATFTASGVAQTSLGNAVQYIRTNGSGPVTISAGGYYEACRVDHANMAGMSFAGAGQDRTIVHNVVDMGKGNICAFYPISVSGITFDHITDSGSKISSALRLDTAAGVLDTAALTYTWDDAAPGKTTVTNCKFSYCEDGIQSSAFGFGRYTTAERDALTVAENTVVQNTTVAKLQVWSGGAWKDLTTSRLYNTIQVEVGGCTFDNCAQGAGGGQTHSIYVSARTSEAIVRDCTFSGIASSTSTAVGHHLKSRAPVTTVTGCTFNPASESYSIDCPLGGILTIDNCTIEQGQYTNNSTIINFGHEPWSWNTIPEVFLAQPFAINISNSTIKSSVVTSPIGISIGANAADSAAIASAYAATKVTLTNVHFVGVQTPVSGGTVSYSGCTKDGVAIPDTTPAPGPSPSPSSSPAWRAGLPVGTFKELPGTGLTNMAAPPPSGTLDVWCGLAKMPAGWVFALSGGHSNGSWNGVIRIDFAQDAPKWEWLSSATDPSLCYSAPEVFIWGDQFGRMVDGKPSARHTYYTPQYLESVNQVIFPLSPGAAVSWYPSRPIWSVNTASTEDGWRFDAFDVATREWLPPATYGHMMFPWVNATAITCIKHPVSEDIYFADTNSIWLKWTRATNTWTRWSPTVGAGYVNGIVDVSRNRIVLLARPLSGQTACNRLARIDVGSGAVDYFNLNFVDGNIINYPDQNYSQLTHDTDLDAYYIALTNGRIFKIDPTSGDTRLHSQQLAATNGVQSRFAYFSSVKGIMYYPFHASNIWFMATQ